MSIINLSPYHQYLYSPVSYIHKIQTKYKVLFIVLYLLSILYIPYIILIMLSILLIIFFKLFNYLQNKCKYKNKLLPILFIYIITLITLICSSKKFLLRNYRYNKIIYPDCLIYNSLFIIVFQFCYIPNILIKTFFFLYNTIGLLCIVFCTTQFENIIIAILSVINHQHKRKNSFNILFISSCFLSLQLLYITINQFKHKIISLKIRKINEKNNKYIIYIYYCIFFINQVINNIKNIACTLYSKDMEYRFLYLMSI